MKKILLVVAVALMCIACGEKNGADLQDNDVKAFIAATADVVPLLGKDAAQMEKILLSAGFIFEEELKTSVKGYVYPKEIQSMNKEEGNMYLKELLMNGKSLIYAYVTSNEDGTLAYVETYGYSGQTDKVNLTYTTISDKLYTHISKNTKESSWKGIIQFSLENKEGIDFENHKEFISTIAAAKTIYAQERGSAKTSNKSFSYSDYWTWDDGTDKIGVPNVISYFIVRGSNTIK